MNGKKQKKNKANLFLWLYGIKQMYFSLWKSHINNEKYTDETVSSSCQIQRTKQKTWPMQGARHPRIYNSWLVYVQFKNNLPQIVSESRLAQMESTTKGKRVQVGDRYMTVTTSTKQNNATTGNCWITTSEIFTYKKLIYISK